MSGQDQIRALEAELAYWKHKLAAANKRAEVAEAEVAARRGAENQKPKEHPAAIEVDWADKPRQPYRIAKCRKCARPIASGDDAELVAAGWERGEDSGRWYCPGCV
jgi:hypothetical protein